MIPFFYSKYPELVRYIYLDYIEKLLREFDKLKINFEKEENLHYTIKE